MTTPNFLKYCCLILLSASIVVIVSLVGLGLIGVLSAPEFRDLSMAVIPSMAGYIPPALSIATGGSKLKPGVIWMPIAVVVFVAYISYFLLLEISIMLYALRPVFDMSTAKLIIGVLQTVFGFFIGGFFVKKLSR